MAKATKNTQPTGAMPLPYRLDLSEREMKWLTRMAEITLEETFPDTEDTESYEEYEFQVWVHDLQETFRQLDKNT